MFLVLFFLEMVDIISKRNRFQTNQKKIEINTLIQLKEEQIYKLYWLIYKIVMHMCTICLLIDILIFKVLHLTLEKNVKTLDKKNFPYILLSSYNIK